MPGRTDDCALLTAAQAAKADALAGPDHADGTFALMQAAAHAVLDVLLARFASAARIAILCGPGNNGGDGLVLARLLAERGIPAAVFLAGAPRAGSDAGRALAMWLATGGGAPAPLETFRATQHDLVVDALFGAGLSRPLEGEAARAALETRAAGIPVLAVDLPSGVDGDTGEARGPAFRADATVTFFRRKPGHLLLPGRILCGDVVTAGIGISARVLARLGVDTFENRPAVWRHAWPAHPADTHKYARGAVSVVTGGAQSTGAGRLAALAAARAGAGAVTLLGPADALPVLAAASLSAMVAPGDGAADLAAHLAAGKTSALVVGPATGIGQRTAGLVAEALRPAHALALGGRLRGIVLDADALTVMAQAPAEAFDRLGKAACAVVLTPHEGEFGRLFPDLRAGGKLARARAAARLSGAVVLLKGADTVIAAPDGRSAITANATPALATAGSGDVLSGAIAALLAQGMPAWEAACAGAWIHGEAGRLAGEGAGAEGIAEALRAVRPG